MDMTAIPTPAADAMPDAAILAAWGRRKAASRALENTPYDSADRKAFVAEVDAAEALMRASAPTTPAGVEAQLWVGLQRTLNFTEADQDRAVVFGDLDFLEGDDRLDWSEKLIVVALRSLRNLSAPPLTEGWNAALARYQLARRAMLDHPINTGSRPDLAEKEIERDFQPIFDERYAAFEALKAATPPDAATLAEKIAAFALEYEDLPAEAADFEILRADAARLAGQNCRF